MVHLIILTWISILPFVTSLTQKSALIKRIPPISSGSSTDFEIVCAFKILKEDALGARLVDGSTDCQTLNSDENIETSNTEAHLKYFKKITSFETDGKTEALKHFLTMNISYDRSHLFEFFVQKIKEDGFFFTIRFEFNKGDTALVVSSGNGTFSLNIEVNNSSRENGSVDLPMKDLREYHFEIYISRWIDLDGKWIFDYPTQVLFTTVESVVVATGPGAFYRSQANNPTVY